MSDISIPGVTSKFNTDKLIDDLVKAERIPLTRMEDSVDGLRDQKRLWQDMNLRIERFRTSAKQMYGFENPFRERVALSSDDAVLTATASREADEESLSLVVQQTAKADRLLSRPVDRDFRVDSGTYVFRVGEKSVRIRYGGGTMRDFADTVTRKGEGLVRANLIPNTPKTQVLLIESLKTGSANSLFFEEAASDLGLAAGFFERTRTTERDVAIAPENVRPLERPIDPQKVSIREGAVKVGPGGELSLPVNPPVPFEGKMVLELEVSVRNTGEKTQPPPSPPPGPHIPGAGAVELEGVRVESAPSDVRLPDWQPPPPPPVRDDLTILFGSNGAASVPFPPLQESDGFQKIRIPVSDLMSGMTALDIRNRNTFREVEVRNVRLFDPEARGDLRPLNAVSEARDAVLLLDGVEVVRDTNDIDDLIPGVTLSLHRESRDPVSLDVEPDRDRVKEAIIGFIGHYNQLLTQINILTRSEDTVIEEIEYFSDGDREKAREQLGAFKGDLTLMQMKSRLQTIMMNSYPTEAGREVALLSQIGVATDTRSPGRSGGLDARRLKGYLEINERTLDEVLRTRMEAVRQLFGNDTDGDLIADSGVGVQADTYTQPYVANGGIITMKMTTLDGKISRTDRDIENYNRHMEQYEQDLKGKYGRMEGALRDLEDNSRQIENFNRNNSSQ